MAAAPIGSEKAPPGKVGFAAIGGRMARARRLSNEDGSAIVKVFGAFAGVEINKGE
jgi:hypothetical protein